MAHGWFLNRRGELRMQFTFFEAKTMKADMPLFFSVVLMGDAKSQLFMFLAGITAMAFGIEHHVYL